MEEQYNRVPRTLPVLHMSNVVMFPYLLMPLVVSDEESRQVIDYALSQDKTMAFFLDKDKSSPNDLGLNEIGCAVTILRMLRNHDGSISLLLQGTSRIRLQRAVQREPFIIVDVESIPEPADDDTEVRAYK
ncbi:MAG: endopeptidase La, partial [Candidatus Cloacimonetes bacterium]|nr:endopeptidase La [Candidatus Cloacimonadota bacterium]